MILNNLNFMVSILVLGLEVERKLELLNYELMKATVRGILIYIGFWSILKLEKST